MNVFTSVKIGSLEFPNRMLMAPVKTAFGNAKGEVTTRHQAYYRRRAEGGVGAIIVEPMYVDIMGKEHPKQIGINDDNLLGSLNRLSSCIHEGGSLAIAHINHAGRAANSKLAGAPPEAPSEVMCPKSGETPVAMSEDRIKKCVAAYADAARRARTSGFDAIEIQFGLGYLIAQFLSPRTNLREDDYGGSEKNRYRFATEVLEAVLSEVGSNLPIIARISAFEQVEGGLVLEDAVKLSQFLQAHGASAVHVVSGSICDSLPWYFQHIRLPLGKNLEWAGAIKKETDLPVIVAGRMGNPADIRRAVNDCIVDAVALGRPLVADPDLPAKMKANEDDLVMQCGACLQGCFARVKSGEGVACNVNPEAGHEEEIPAKATSRKTVVVVGGGPGGMQAALSSSRLGHKVILYDKGTLGGQFSLSHIPPGKQMMERPLQAFINQVKKSDIDVRLNQSPTAQDIVGQHPDVVVVATGAEPVSLSIPGLQRAVTGEDVLLEKTDMGTNVLIIGGGMIGLEVAEFLTLREYKITVVELLEDVARDMLPLTKKLTLNSLNKAGVKILKGTKITRFDGAKAYVQDGDGEKMIGEFDSVVVAVGTRSINELEPQLRQKGIELRIIGDAKKPRQLFEAVREGYEAARSI